MYKLLRDFTLGSLLILAVTSGAACSPANAGADNSVADQSNQLPSAENKTAGNTAAQSNRQAKAATPVTASSVVGNYTLNDLIKGFGNDNSFEIKNKGNDKLEVNFVGNYIYDNGNGGSAHEVEASGDLQLKGNVATGNLYASLDDDANCRVTITFGANRATVKLSSGCNYNVSLDGVYKKDKSKSASRAAVDSSDEDAEMTEVAYDKLNDFENDFNAHRPGERYEIINIPSFNLDHTDRADSFGNTSYRGLYYLRLTDVNGDTDNTFLISAAMLKSLHANVKEYEPASLRAAAVLIESTGEFDVYRMSFVTKIEGLNDDGSVKWTATGAEPSKTKFTH